jgi:hypothetical protein
MKIERSRRPVFPALLLLFLPACFIVKVEHTTIANGRIAAGPVQYYIDTPKSSIDVARDADGASPQVTVLVSADSDRGLKLLTFEVSKAGGKKSEYETVASRSKQAIFEGEPGYKKWSTHLEMPVVLDLGGTASQPLLLRVTAEEQDGTRKVIESKYRELPAGKPS